MSPIDLSYFQKIWEYPYLFSCLENRSQETGQKKGVVKGKGSFQREKETEKLHFQGLLIKSNTAAAFSQQAPQAGLSQSLEGWWLLCRTQGRLGSAGPKDTAWAARPRQQGGKQQQPLAESSLSSKRISAAKCWVGGRTHSGPMRISKHWLVL